MQIAVAWGISRVLVFSAAAAILLVGAPRGSWRGPRFSSHPFALLERWDGRWCGMVAEHGYLFVPGRYSDAAFFPLLPLLLRGVHLVGLPYRLTGIALTNLALFAALLGIYELGRTWLDEKAARRAAIS